MTVAPQPHQIRELVARTFEEFGAGVGDYEELNETLLVEGRRFVARSYRTKGLLAMWLFSAGVIQFYDADGKMLRTINLFKKLRPRSVAA